jgi:hypothetical protein
MMERIGQKYPKFFGAADLTQGYFQMPLAAFCRRFTAFITFRGLFEWTRVPMGIFPAANFFQLAMQSEVLTNLLYHLCEIYIDDLLMLAKTDKEMVEVVRVILQRLREKGILLNPRKVRLGAPSTVFVGHLLDGTGISMTQERIDNTVNIKEPGNVKELQSFLGVANYFRDHIRNHSSVVRPLKDMVTAATRLKSKYIQWTDSSKDAFVTLKRMINACPKLYLIDNASRIVLCTDASDYAFGAYLYQVVKTGTSEVQQPIRFLSKSFVGAQVRWSTIEKEAYAIYYALRAMEHLLGGRHFTLRTDHNNLLFLNNAGSTKVFNWKLSIQHFDF